MASLSAALDTNSVRESARNLVYKIANGETVYIGGYYALNAAGYLTEPTDTAGVRLLGIIQGFGGGAADAGGALPLSVAGDTSASPVPEAIVDVESKLINDIAVSGASSIADVGSAVYLSSDNWSADLTLTPTTNLPPIGFITKSNSATSFEVYLYSAAEALALAKQPSYLKATLHTTVLEGSASANIAQIKPPHAGVITAIYSRPTGFDAGYAAGDQSCSLMVDTGAVSGGVIRLIESQCDAIGDLDAFTTATAVTNTSGNAEFSAGSLIRVILAASGTGFTAAVDTVSFEIYIEYTELPS